jgi:putative flippase GtrA
MAEKPAGLSGLLADQRVRFLIVGGINTIVGYGLFVLIQWLFGAVISYFGSILIAHLFASMLAFTLYRRWVFKAGRTVVVDFLRFQVVYLVPLAANLLALPILVAGVGLNVYLAQALIVVVSTIVSFLGHKYFSFRRAVAPADDSEPQ